MNNWYEKYKEVRQLSKDICKPLQKEDYVVQPVVDVSPPKWHIGHTTWFFETFILKNQQPGYKEFDPNYNYVFNSYYEAAGARVVRTDRGNLSRPTVDDVYAYRRHVDAAMESFLSGDVPGDVLELLSLGLNHEQQHQELLLTDIKYILGNNPLMPPYINSAALKDQAPEGTSGFISMDEGVYEIGYKGNDFCFDNELGVHKVYLQQYSLAENLVTNGEFLQFIEAGGYSNFTYWHSEGWDWVKNNKIAAPMYWHQMDGEWFCYTYNGLQLLEKNDILNHISFYEASAFSAFKGLRLPTEFEWEAAAPKLHWGKRWEWTESAYLPYPGFTKAPGAIGEYNGKFMVNQMVLRGSSEITSPGHSRLTYRNFFHPYLRWQYMGIRLAK